MKKGNESKEQAKRRERGELTVKEKRREGRNREKGRVRRKKEREEKV